MSKENTNCLAGMQCPNCNSYGPFKIGVETVCLISDEGTEAHYDEEWGDDSYCECNECHHAGKVRMFQRGQRKQKEVKP